MSLAVGYTEAAPAVTISRVDDPLFPQLHHGNRGEGLGDRRDPKDRVLGSRGLRLDVGDAVSGEPLQRSVADHAYRRPTAGQRLRTSATLNFIPGPSIPAPSWIRWVRPASPCPPFLGHWHACASRGRDAHLQQRDAQAVGQERALGGDLDDAGGCPPLS